MGSQFVQQQLFHNGGIGLVLNRSKQLNVLNKEMLTTIRQRIEEQLASPRTANIPPPPFLILEGKGKAFCAGGDVKSIGERNESKPYYNSFFQIEYGLYCALYDLPIPYVALWDGIVMGGGMGISASASIKIATENTLFAMPECTIGLFPDVGCSYFLNQIEIDGMKRPDVALYLALTGQILPAVDVLKTSLATHYVPHAKLPELKSNLASFSSSHSKADNLKLIQDIFKDFHEQPVDNSKLNLDEISDCFSEVSCIEKVFQNLEKRESKWSNYTRKQLEVLSPSALKLTFEQMNRGAKNMSVKDCFNMEYNLALNCMPWEGNDYTDFKEGVRSVLVDKDRSPRWKPSSLDRVSMTKILRFFEPISNDLGQRLEIKPFILTSE